MASTYILEFTVGHLWFKKCKIHWQSMQIFLIFQFWLLSIFQIGSYQSCHKLNYQWFLHLFWFKMLLHKSQCYYAISILHYSESWQLNQLQACKWNVELSTSWNVGGESFALKDKWMHVFPNRIILLRSILSSTAYLVGKFNALAIVEVNEEQMK